MNAESVALRALSGAKLVVPDVPTDGRPSTEEWTRLSTVASDARPIPELPVVDDVAGVMAAFAGDTGVVGDDERARYGVLLDRAAERGLLTPQEYGFRLGELASATTVDRMRELVTELPMLVSPVAKPARRLRSAKAPAAAVPPAGLASSTGPAVPTRPADGRSNQWLMLAVVVVVLVLALLFFSIYAEHVAHSHQSGLAPTTGVVVRTLSVLRS